MKKALLILLLCFSSFSFAKADAAKFDERKTWEAMLNEKLSSILEKEVSFTLEKTRLTVKDPTCGDYQQILTFLKRLTELNEEKVQSAKQNQETWQILLKDTRTFGKIAFGYSIALGCQPPPQSTPQKDSPLIL